MMDETFSSQGMVGIIANRYKVIKTVSGGMGVVYLCVDTAQDNFPVALKTFKSEYLPDQNTRERFMREAAIWVEIGWHPNIVQAYRVEYVTSTHGVYLVLEMVPPLTGKKDPSLRSYLTPGTAISLEKTLEVALEISRGMKFATAKIPGLVHRDLKPENILISPDGSCHITDFGLVSVTANIIEKTKSLIPLGEHATIGPMGTPLYMSPEQWLGQVALPSSDIYSTGCIILEMLTGDFIIQGENIKDLAEGHIKGKALQRLQVANIPSPLKVFLSICLQPDSSIRLQAWSQFEEEVIKLIDSLLHRKIEPESLLIDVSIHTQRLKGESLLAIGEAYLDISEGQAAIQCFEQAISIGKDQRYPELVASAEANIGVACFALGEYERSISYYNNAITLWRECGNVEYAILNYGNIGNAYFRLGNLEKAKEHLEKVIVFAKEIRDSRTEAFWVANLANVISNLGDNRKALDYYQQALVVEQNNGDLFSECKTLGSMGTAYERLGDFQKAKERFESALSIADRIGDQQTAVLVSLGLSHIMVRQGKTQEAIKICQIALGLAEKVNDLGLIAQAHGDLGTAHMITGEFDQGISHAQEALRVAIHIHARQIEARAHLSLGVAYEMKMDLNNAIKQLREAVILFKELHLPEYEQASHHLVDLRKTLGLL